MPARAVRYRGDGRQYVVACYAKSCDNIATSFDYKKSELMIIRHATASV